MTPSLACTVVAVSLGSVFKDGGSKAILRSPASTKRGKATDSDRLGRLYKSWFGVSRPVRFFVSGNLGSVVFFLLERFIYQVLTSQEDLPKLVDEYKETISFFWGYALQIVVQHMLHAFLVYGLDTIATREKYIKTLLSQFYAYGFALVGSTLLNLFLIRSGFDKTVSFFTTMVIFACINYYLIGFLMERSIASVDKSNGKRKPRTKTVAKKPTPPRSTQSRSSGSKNKSKSNSRAFVRKTPRGGAAFLPGAVFATSPLKTQDFLDALSLTAPSVDTRQIQDVSLMGIGSDCTDTHI